MDTASFYFHDDLTDFLPRRQKNQPITHTFDWRASIKDMIESLGPPHSEIELILVNGRSVDFDHIVMDGDNVHVYSRFEAVEQPDRVRLRPPFAVPPRFVLDIHLGRLAAYLRMMGFDTAFGDTTNHDEDFDDAVLAQVAHDENRILLSRDVGLLKRSIVTYGYWVRNTDPYLRLAEIARRFSLASYARPFKRCMKCNGLLYPVEKSAIIDRLEPDTILYVHDFHQCDACGQIYWRGSHMQRMQKMVDDVFAEMESEPHAD